MYYVPRLRRLLQIRAWGSIRSFTHCGDDSSSDAIRLRSTLDKAVTNEPGCIVVDAGQAGFMVEPASHASPAVLLGYQRLRHGDIVGFVVLLADGATDTDASHRNRMVALMPGLAAALQAEHALSGANTWLCTTAFLLDQRQATLIVLDGSTRIHVVYAEDGCSSLPEDFFSARGDGSLRTYYPAENARLQAALAELLGQTSAEVPGVPRQVIVHARDSGLRHALLSMCVIDADARDSARPCIAVLVRDSSCRKQPSPELLRMTFELTRAETQLAVALLNGLSLREIALRQERSITTLRTHLRGLCRKTSARRQSELLRTLSTTAC